MEGYKNLGGNSNVSAYKIESDSITVRFNDGRHYLYNYQSTGQVIVEHMKTLGIAGQGLNSFISRVVKSNYASEW
jgi:hypothetical protein